MTRLIPINKNVSAMLDAIAWCEGTSTSKWTRDDGYDIIVAGIDSPRRFSSYAQHPNIRVKVNAKINSTAAGRYQTLRRNWIAYQQVLSLSDFSPANQDRIAIQQIKEFRALPLIEAGKIKQAIQIIAPLWASLPGAGHNQPERDLNAVLAQYVKAGGTLSA